MTLKYHAYFDEWDRIPAGAERRLLRLSLLRDFARKLHSDKSVSLAQSDASAKLQYPGIEPRLKELCAQPIETTPLQQLLNGLKNTAPATASSLIEIPSAIHLWIERENLHRYDRFWELEIAREAFRQNWAFFEFRAWIHIHMADQFHTSISKELWPHGILLFVENAQGMRADLWNGRWLGVMKPEIPASNRISFDSLFEKQPGASITPEKPVFKWVDPTA